MFLFVTKRTESLVLLAITNFSFTTCSSSMTEKLYHDRKTLSVENNAALLRKTMTHIVYQLTDSS